MEQERLDTKRLASEMPDIHKNNIMLGITEKPLKHRSRSVIALEKQGIENDRSNINHDIMKSNLKDKKRQKKREHDRDRGR